MNPNISFSFDLVLSYKNQKPHAHLHMIRRRSIKFQISPMKDVRGVAGTRSDGRTEGRTDGRTHGRTRVIFIAHLRLHRVTKKRVRRADFSEPFR